jgi:hypothetical protein
MRMMTMNLEEYADALDDATLQLNNGFELIEKRFAAMGLNVKAEVPISDTHLLGYGKHVKGWRLYFRTNEPGSDQQPLLNGCSRKMRVEIVPHLGALKKALVDASATQLRVVQEAVVAMQAFIQELDDPAAS